MRSGTLPEQIRPALAGVEVAGGAFDAGVKPPRSFRLRGTMQSADDAPVGDRRILGRSPIVRSPVESNGGGGNDDVADFGFADQAAARSHANEDPRAAADRFRQHDAHRRAAHARKWSPKCRYRGTFRCAKPARGRRLKSAATSFKILLGDHVRAAGSAHDQTQRRQIVRAGVRVIFTPPAALGLSARSMIYIKT